MGFHHPPFEPNSIYHIYNHAVGYNNLFREEKNYEFFLSKLLARIAPFAELYAYCLLPNHFHLLIRINDTGTLTDLWKEKINAKRIYKPHTNHFSDSEFFNQLIISEFAAVFNSYALAFNKTYRRKGALLRESFRRKLISDHDDLQQLICYIHNNPVMHGYTNEPEDWKYCSYQSFVTDQNRFSGSGKMKKIFVDKENFFAMHRQYKHLDDCHLL